MEGSRPSPRRGQPLTMLELRLAMSAMIGILLHQQGQVELDESELSWRLAVVRDALAGLPTGGSSGATQEALPFAKRGQAAD